MLHFDVSTDPFLKTCNLISYVIHGLKVKFPEYCVFRNYSLHHELQFDGSTFLFIIDFYMTPLVHLLPQELSFMSPNSSPLKKLD